MGKSTSDKPAANGLWRIRAVIKEWKTKHHFILVDDAL
jgi:hypothetical protein